MVIFDKSSQSSIIFASPKYDKSDRILKKMGIKPGESINEERDSNTTKPSGGQSGGLNDSNNRR